MDAYPHTYLGLQRLCLSVSPQKYQDVKIKPIQFKPLSVDILQLLLTYQPVGAAINTPDCLILYK